VILAKTGGVSQWKKTDGIPKKCGALIVDTNIQRKNYHMNYFNNKRR
tara:strand:+ start:111 stop:251 length:141 start_codon:yes stop_codon:yes gene_type:complete